MRRKDAYGDEMVATYCKIFKYAPGMTGKIRSGYLNNRNHMCCFLKDKSRIIRLL